MSRRPSRHMAAPRYLRPRRVDLADRDARYAEDGVQAGTYEVHPDGSWRRVRVYRRGVTRRAGIAGGPLRRVKHMPTIRAVLEKLQADLQTPSNPGAS